MRGGERCQAYLKHIWNFYLHFHLQRVRKLLHSLENFSAWVYKALKNYFKGECNNVLVIFSIIIMLNN
jgi:hypothetical protein